MLELHNIRINYAVKFELHEWYNYPVAAVHIVQDM